MRDRIKPLIRLYLTILVGKPEGKRSLGRPTCGWDDNIKIFLKEIGCDGVNWIRLAQDSD